jgi:hypothetical protein
MPAQIQLIKNNLANSKEATTISRSYSSTIINTLEFNNKNQHHELIMAKREIRELRTRIFVNESLLEDIKLEKMELERKLSQTRKGLNEDMVMSMKVQDSCPWD